MSYKILKIHIQSGICQKSWHRSSIKYRSYKVNTSNLTESLCLEFKYRYSSWEIPNNCLFILQTAYSTIFMQK